MNMIPSRAGKNNIEFIDIDAMGKVFEKIQGHKQTNGKTEFMGKEYTATQNQITEALKTSGRNI
jgi:predicted transcriptional regulator